MGISSRGKTSQALSNSTRVVSRAAALRVGLVFFAGLFVAVVLAVVYGWQQWGRTVVARPIYRIAEENIQVTPPPPWIRSDVRAEVVRDGSLSDLTIFDKDAALRVYQAFELHPWVAKVKRVSKHPPARLVVDLQFRRPVAWVEVPRGAVPGTSGGVIPVDADAVVLPSRDFTPENVGDYLRISVPGLPPCGLAGTAWGDARLAGATRIATLLDQSWQSWKLFRIRLASTDMARREPEPVYELETSSQKPIIWGAAPGHESSGEPSPAAKLTRLTQLVEIYGDLDRIPDSTWDLRHADMPLTREARRGDLLR